MRSELLYLTDIVQACDDVADFLLEVDDAADFETNKLVRSAVLHQLTMIGEACGKVSAGTRAQYPHIAWRQIVGFRNFIVHAYFSVDWIIVWNSATNDVPALRPDIQQIIDDTTT